MTATYHVAGAANIWVDTGASHALAFLGLTENGAEVTFDEYTSDIPVDDQGGSEGQPGDIQYFGETAEIRLTLSKFDSAVAALVTCRLRGQTSGVPATPGTLIFAGNLFNRLVILSANDPLNFPCVVFRKPIEIGKGTKYSRLVLTGTAYKAPPTHAIAEFQSLLYNADTGAQTW